MLQRFQDTPLTSADAATMLRIPVDGTVGEAPWMRASSSWDAILGVMATAGETPPEAMRAWVHALAAASLDHPQALVGQDRLIAAMCPLTEIRLGVWWTTGFGERVLQRLQAPRTPPMAWDAVIPMLWQVDSHPSTPKAAYLAAHPMDAHALEQALALTWRDRDIWTALAQRGRALGWPAPLQVVMLRAMERVVHRRHTPWSVACLEACGAYLSAEALAAVTLHPERQDFLDDQQALMDLWLSLSDAWWTTMPQAVVEQILAGPNAALRLLMVTRLSARLEAAPAVASAGAPLPVTPRC